LLRSSAHLLGDFPHAGRTACCSLHFSFVEKRLFY